MAFSEETKRDVRWALENAHRAGITLEEAAQAMVTLANRLSRDIDQALEQLRKNLTGIVGRTKENLTRSERASE